MSSISNTNDNGKRASSSSSWLHQGVKFLRKAGQATGIVPESPEEAFQNWKETFKKAEMNEGTHDSYKKLAKYLEDFSKNSENNLYIEYTHSHTLQIPRDVFAFAFQNKKLLLEKIYVHTTKSPELPSSIGDLENLKEIYLNRILGLTTLPDSIGNLKNLENLLIQTSRFFEALPDTIVGCQKLKNITIKESSLHTLPKDIGNLKNLVTLDVSESKLTTLPESIGNLTNLGNLDFRYNPSLKSLPASFKNLTHLKTLSLQGTNIKYEDIPPEIRNLPEIVIDIKPQDAEPTKPSQR